MLQKAATTSKQCVHVRVSIVPLRRSHFPVPLLVVVVEVLTLIVSIHATQSGPPAQNSKFVRVTKFYVIFCGFPLLLDIDTTALMMDKLILHTSNKYFSFISAPRVFNGGASDVSTPLGLVVTY